jgi:hypothetical protein
MPSSPAARTLALIVLSLIVLSCGSDGVSPEPQAIATTLEKVSGDDQQAAAGLALGADLVVRVRDQNGQALAGAPVSWQVTGGGGSVDAATSPTDGQGFARTRWTLGAAAGANTARATLGSLAPAVFNAQGVAGAAATVTVSPDTITLTAGEDQIQLEADVRDQNGNVVADPNIVWSSGDESIATVDADGLVEAVAEGEVAITAVSGNAVGEAIVHVLPQPLVCTEVLTFGTGETLSGALPGVLVTGSVTVAGPTTICGNLAIGTSGQLDLAGQTVAVAGNFSTASSGRLVMQASEDRLTVGGNAAFNGSSNAGDLTDGVLEVAGNFSMPEGSIYRFRAESSHQVVLNGTTAQSVTFHFSGPTLNRFHDLRIESPGGVSFTTDSHVNGTLTVDASSALVTGAGRTVTVGDNMVDTGHRWRVANTQFSGSPALPAAMTTHASFIGQATLTNDVNLTGNVTVAGSGRLNLGGHKLEITGNFSTAGSGRLVMQASEDRLTVGGNAAFNGSSNAGDLKDGVLEVAGNFSMPEGSIYRFRAESSHQVVLNGATAQSVTFHFSGPTLNRFHDLRIANSAGVTFATSNQINGGLDLVEVATIPGGVTLTLVGALTLRSTAVLNNSGTMTVGSCTKEAGHTINGTDPCP